MDNTQMVQILPLSCGIYSDGIFITAEDSDAVIKIMREHDELSRKGSGAALLTLLGICGLTMFTIYKINKTVMEKLEKPEKTKEPEEIEEPNKKDNQDGQ